MPEELDLNPVAQRIELIYECAAMIAEQDKAAHPEYRGWEDLAASDRQNIIAAVETQLASPDKAVGNDFLWQAVGILRQDLASDGLLRDSEKYATAEGLQPPAQGDEAEEGNAQEVSQTPDVPPPGLKSVAAGLEDGIPAPGADAGPVPGEVQPEPMSKPIPAYKAYIDIDGITGFDLGQLASRCNQLGYQWRQMAHVWSRSTHGKLLVELSIPEGATVPPEVQTRILVNFDPGEEPGKGDADLLPDANIKATLAGHETVGAERAALRNNPGR